MGAKKSTSGLKLHRITAVFSQESSTKPDDWEELTVEMHFLPGAGGPYWTFKSKQWAIEDPQEIIHILESMKDLSKQHDTLL